MADKFYDIYIVGVGGQGVLTIADIITLTAAKNGVDVNYYPTKGMAQRGGFVKAQLRLGRKADTFGPSISEGGADLVVSMELCETLRAIRYAKEGADYVVLGNMWEPTEVMLGNGAYPSKDEVLSEIRKFGGKVNYLDPADVPSFARDNLYTLGTVFAQSKLSEIFSQEQIEATITERWPKVAEGNLKTFRAGIEAAVEN
ncbi:MAG: 2-oxoacid:acceptor oxidoreductase family protein [Wujia sp.]